MRYIELIEIMHKYRNQEISKLEMISVFYVWQGSKIFAPFNWRLYLYENKHFHNHH